MRKQLQIRVPPERRDDHAGIIRDAIRSSRLDPDRTFGKIRKRSIDARKETVRYVFQVEVWDEKDDEPADKAPIQFTTVSTEKTAHIIGAGPAGYFAALELLRQGVRPVIFERGKDVRARRRDLRAIQQFHVVDPDSNYCFGEGGAGTYSDGKLYTRSTKRGNVSEVLQVLVDHGADPDIMIDAHPHIGSNKLPGIIAAIRSTIEEKGGEVHFQSRVTDFVLKAGRIVALQVNEEREVPVESVILATGHSARDIYNMLDQCGIKMEFKPFALGVRIEHPQQLIDSIQYHCDVRGPYLPAASYRLAAKAGGRPVFSFCMCPGGLIVPAATAPGEIVLNGMSLSRRDSPYANAGTVVGVDEDLVREFAGKQQVTALDGIAYQSHVERKAFETGDGTQKAPAQRLVDFTEGRTTTDLPGSSYIPGLRSENLDEILPSAIAGALRQGIRQFGKKMRGYYTNEAIIAATESRTSSPVRIPRDAQTHMHPEVFGLFPCGEGAGYAGGIVSAAIDGRNVAMQCAGLLKEKMKSNHEKLG